MISPKYADPAKLKKKFVAKPFPHLAIPNFFSKEIDKVPKALLKEKWHDIDSDLFKFKQTDDCKKAKQKVVKYFYKYLNSKEFLTYMSELTGIKLKWTSMTGFIYSDTDYLLPHDDRLQGRKVAYIANFSKNFTKEDGGALQLFKGKKIVKELTPTYNTLTIFKVSPKSLHKVQEVFSKKKRISLSGWFHG